MKRPMQVQSNLIMMVFRSTYIEEQIGKIMIIRFEERPLDVGERHSRAKFLVKISRDKTEWGNTDEEETDSR